MVTCPASPQCSPWLGEHPVAYEVELRTLASDFGANGYATITQVDELARVLGLGPGRRLLDIGAGQGWPGLYLACQTGCTVVVTDLDVDGPAAASRRATQEGIESRAWSVVNRGETLPLRSASFDAVVHTDVLCCLGPKLATLQETRRVLRPGGRTAFSVIFPAPGLPETHERQAITAGPPECVLRGTYPNLLRSSGFVEIDEYDLTSDYLATATRKLEQGERLAVGLAEVLGGREEFEQTQARRRIAIEAIADGLLRRSLFMARRPNDPYTTNHEYEENQPCRTRPSSV